MIDLGIWTLGVDIIGFNICVFRPCRVLLLQMLATSILTILGDYTGESLCFIRQNFLLIGYWRLHVHLVDGVLGIHGAPVCYVAVLLFYMYGHNYGNST